MHGAIPTLPQYVFMVLCLVKHRDGTTLPLPLPLPLPSTFHHISVIFQNEKEVAYDSTILNMRINPEVLKIAMCTNTRQVSQYFE